jgi:hypothetical protein
MIPSTKNTATQGVCALSVKNGYGKMCGIPYRREELLRRGNEVREVTRAVVGMRHNVTISHVFERTPAQHRYISRSCDLGVALSRLGAVANESNRALVNDRHLTPPLAS